MAMKRTGECTVRVERERGGERERERDFFVPLELYN